MRRGGRSEAIHLEAGAGDSLLQAGGPKGRAVSTTGPGRVARSRLHQSSRVLRHRPLVGELISAKTHPTETGGGPTPGSASPGVPARRKSGGRSNREDIKRGGKEAQVPVVCANDAALRGSNLADPGFPLIQRGSPLEPSRNSSSGSVASKRYGPATPRSRHGEPWSMRARSMRGCV